MSAAGATKRLAGGFEMPLFGIGTFRMGERRAEERREVDAIRAAIQRGVRHIDTAELYGDGRAEQLVAEAIRDVDRAGLFLVTKVAPSHLRRESVLRAADASLRRLGTDYVDLYLVHHPNPRIPLDETMSALDELVDRGLVRAIGVSNFAPARQRAAIEAARHPVVANQVHYSLLHREPEHVGLLEACHADDVMLVAWRPVELGRLTTRDVPLLAEVADRYGRTPAQVALNWLVSQPNVVALVKTSSVEHLDENLGALGWELDNADVERLRREFPGQRDISAVPLR